MAETTKKHLPTWMVITEDNVQAIFGEDINLEDFRDLMEGDEGSDDEEDDSMFGHDAWGDDDADDLYSAKYQQYRDANLGNDPSGRRTDT